MDAAVAAVEAIIDAAADGPLDLSGKATLYNAVEAALLQKERQLARCPTVSKEWGTHGMLSWAVMAVLRCGRGRSSRGDAHNV